MAVERPKDELSKSARRWEALLDAATIILNGRGVSSGLLNELAQGLGVTREALYYYVRDREDVVFQVYLRTSEYLAEVVDAVRTADGTALDKVRMFIERALAADAPEMASFNEIGVLSEDQLAQVRAQVAKASAGLAAIVAEGTASGALRAVDPWFAAQTIISLVQSQSSTARRNILIGESAIGRADYRRTLADLVERGWAVQRVPVNDVTLVDLEPLVRTKATAFDRDALSAAKKEMILLKTSHLVNRCGVASVSMDRIASEIGVSKRSIYGLIGDKAAVIRACRHRNAEILLTSWRRAATMGGGPVLEFVRASRSAVLLQIHPELEPMMAAAFYDGMTDEEAADFKANIQTLNDSFRGALEALFEAGACRRLDFVTASQVIPVAQLWLTKGAEDVGAIDPMRAAVEVTDLMRLGLAPLA